MTPIDFLFLFGGFILGAFMVAVWYMNFLIKNSSDDTYIRLKGKAYSVRRTKEKDDLFL